jgi:hypothetical protein
MYFGFIEVPTYYIDLMHMNFMEYRIMFLWWKLMTYWSTLGMKKNTMNTSI